MSSSEVSRFNIDYLDTRKLIEKAKVIKAKAGSEKVTLEMGVLRQDGRPQRFDEDPDNSI